jgi:ribosomal-protein-alanine N-acetyltransferase
MIETNFTPFPILTTERLVLRQLEATDDKDIFSHRSDERVNAYLEDFRHTSIEQTQAFINRIQKEVANNKTILWVITQKGHNKFLGTICLWNISKNDNKAETGYTLDPIFQRMGYMNEALVEIIDFGFNKMKLKTIEAYTHKDNESSIRLLLKNKFKLDTTRKAEKENNRIIFTLTNENL